MRMQLSFVLAAMNMDGEVRRGDDILTDALVVNLESAGAVHTGGRGADNICDAL